MIYGVCCGAATWVLANCIWDNWRYRRADRDRLSLVVVPELPLWHVLWPYWFWGEWEARHVIWCLENDGPDDDRWTLVSL